MIVNNISLINVVALSKLHPYLIFMLNETKFNIQTKVINSVRLEKKKQNEIE